MIGENTVFKNYTSIHRALAPVPKSSKELKEYLMLKASSSISLDPELISKLACGIIRISRFVAVRLTGQLKNSLDKSTSQLSTIIVNLLVVFFDYKDKSKKNMDTTNLEAELQSVHKSSIFVVKRFYEVFNSISLYITKFITIEKFSEALKLDLNAKFKPQNLQKDIDYVKILVKPCKRLLEHCKEWSVKSDLENIDFGPGTSLIFKIHKNGKNCIPLLANEKDKKSFIEAMKEIIKKMLLSMELWMNIQPLPRNSKECTEMIKKFKSSLNIHPPLFTILNSIANLQNSSSQNAKTAQEDKQANSLTLPRDTGSKRAASQVFSNQDTLDITNLISVKKIFQVNLDQVQLKDDVPEFLLKTFSWIEKYAKDVPNLFNSGIGFEQPEKILELEKQFESVLGDDYNQNEDPYVVAEILKDFFIKLPNPLCFYPARFITECSDISDKELRLKTLFFVFKILTKVERKTLFSLVEFLLRNNFQIESISSIWGKKKKLFFLFFIYF